MRKTRDTGGYLPGKALSAGLFRRARAAALCAFMLGAASILRGQVVRTGSTTVTANVAADASITVSTPTVLTAGAAFGAFTGSTTVTFSIRTTKVGGSGSITLQAAEFTTAGGPLVSAGNLTYSCSGTPSVGTKCAGPITASTSAPTAVLSAVGADAKANAQVVNVDWTLANSPAFSTGSYSSTVTFTLSSN
ncbi:MAG TPA: hypothetical protein VIZ69_06065 [Thermoanaerobaculia bacterium]